MSAVFGDSHQRLSLYWSLYPFWQVVSDIIHSCLIFKIFNLSVLTQFTGYSVLSVADVPLCCVFLSSTSYMHTLCHTFFEDTVCLSRHTHHLKEMRTKRCRFFRYCYLFIYLFQARRRLLSVMYISFRSTIYMHFVSFFVFLCSIIHGLV